MARRSQPHLIQISNVERPHRVTSGEWNRLASAGVITPKRLDDGRVSRRVAQLNLGAFLWIYTSWIAIDRRAPMIRGEFYLRELLRQYCGRVREDADVIDRRGQFEGPGGKAVKL